MLRAALSGDYYGAKVALTDEVKKLIEELTNFKEIKLPKGINATLRPYQQRGFSWIYRNAQIGFGSVLADDMGLGKTLQVLAFLQLQVNQNRGANLVVVPTTLLFNWENELKKFAI